MIDETTGLPELPKGQYWRVERVRFGYHNHEWTIQIEEPPEEPYWSEWKRDPYPELGESEQTEKRTVTVGRTWYGKRKLRHEERYWNKPEPYTVRLHVIELEGDFPTPENIRNAANACIEYAEKAAKAQKLIGKYPPNKLEAP